MDEQSVNEWLENARRIAGRSLTEKERIQFGLD